MSSKYLNDSGLAYFWSKIKAWCNAVFAPIVHTHTSYAVKHSYTTATNAAKNWYRIANANTSQTDTTKPIHAQFILTAYNASYDSEYYERWFINAEVFGRTAHIAIFGNTDAPFSQARILYENTIADLDSNDRPAIDIYLNYQLANGTTKIEIEEVYNSGWTFVADGQISASSVPSGFESAVCSIRSNGIERSTYADYASYLNRQVSNITAAFTLVNNWLYRSRTLNCTGTFTITIPSINSGYMWCVIKNNNTSSGVITLHPSTTSVLIDGSNADITLQPMEYVCIHSAGANNYSLIADGRWKSQKADKATTLAGYGITDAKIVNGTITLGSNNITPLTSVPNHNQASNTITAMTGYSKPGSGGAIAASDSLNAAIGKLEFKVDSIDVSNYLPSTGGTVTGTITATSGAAFNQRHASYIKGNSYSSNVYLGQGWHDKNGTVLADLLYYLNAPANDGHACLAFRVFGNPNYSGSQIDAYLGVYVSPTGETFGACPTPSSTTENSNKIATTEWVRKATGNTALNAASATKLANARTINGVPFNGTANITVADSTKVAKSGDTMTGTLTISNTAPLYYLRNTNVTKGTVPSAFQWSQIIFFGKTGSSINDRMGFIEQETRTDGFNILRLASCRNIANTFDYSWLSIDAPDDSTKRCYVNLCGLNKDVMFVNNDMTFGTNPSSTIWWSIVNHSRTDWISGIWSYVDTNGLSQIELRVRGNSTSLSYKHFWLFQNRSGDSHAGVDTNSFRPTLNTFSTLGIAGTGRWGQIYSTSATINTSDERQKCDIEAIPDDVLDAWETCEFYQYRMKDSVDKKGKNARYHTGMIAQRLDKKFKDANENLNKYGLFCYDEWDDIEARKDDKDNIVEPAVEAGDEYSIRYEEALCMEAACQRRENARLKKRIADLEERLAALELKIV